jgi:hypothetical protein
MPRLHVVHAARSPHSVASAGGGTGDPDKDFSAGACISRIALHGLYFAPSLIHWQGHWEEMLAGLGF